jgi:hypothetical protein
MEGASESPRRYCKDGRYLPNGVISDGDLMNAREVPVAREFWVNEYHVGGRSVYLTKEEAEKYTACLQRTIHVREVLPGEGA